jgi:phospholipase A2
MHTHSQWTPEQINNLTTLAKTNFGEGADQLKRTVRAVYERKKKQRLGREEMDKKQKREREEAEDELAHAENERSHTGHFS